MGETSAETRVEVDRIRDDLSRDIRDLRGEAGRLRRRGARLGGAGAAAAALAGLVGAAGLMVRRRRGGRLTAASRRLPARFRSSLAGRARRADRALQDGAGSARRGGERISRRVLRRYADERAEAEKRRNPLWRRTLEATLKAGAAATVTQLLRRAVTGGAPRG